jgi:hypothetical protein
VPGGLADGQFEYTHDKEEDFMENLWMALFWTGPIGTGFFLMGLGVLFWGISKLVKSK